MLHFPTQAKPPGLDSVLEAAALCLGQAGAEATGAALIEGLLCVAPAPCFACCLQVALVSRPSDALRAALGMLCKVPAGMLPPAVIAEALAQVGKLFGWVGGGVGGGDQWKGHGKERVVPSVLV